MKMDEGYIKFKCHWEKTAPLPSESILKLNYWRNKMYDNQLIGAYENGIGYGNISERKNANHQFIISGTATGNLAHLTAEHYALVTAVKASSNELWCEGSIRASSESMSHAIIYKCCPKVNVVIHVHHLEMWKALLYKVPTTDQSAAYGTPEMVASIARLFAETDLRTQQIFAMEGHKEGLFAFGENFAKTAHVLINELAKLKTQI